MELYDATLRDGMQGTGMSLTAHEKIRFAHQLDALGVDYIEAGFPASNPKEQQMFELLQGESFNAHIVAFGATRHKDHAVEEDPNVRVLADTYTQTCTIVGKTWSKHVQGVLGVSNEENLHMISETIEFLRSSGKTVIYDAEHFFDAYKDDPQYTLECLAVANEAGASRLILCDTNGATMPWDIAAAVEHVSSLFPHVGIHCHNDSDVGVANTLTAVRAGAMHVQGTINGIGERTGNANLLSIIAGLQLKMDYDILSEEQLHTLTHVSRTLDEMLNRSAIVQQPYVGKFAFAHKGGLHAAGVGTDATTFEHIDPALVGNTNTVTVSELGGKHSLAHFARSVNIDLSDEQLRKTMDIVKTREHEGFQYEAATESLELLLRQENGLFHPLFQLESWRVIVEAGEDSVPKTEATIKLWVPNKQHGKRLVQTAEGNGPVNALDAALRAAITQSYPHLAAVELQDYKVRILDSQHGTNAVTRVLLQSSDHEQTWTTIGVGENLIAASWQALVQSLEWPQQQ